MGRFLYGHLSGQTFPRDYKGKNERGLGHFIPLPVVKEVKSLFFISTFLYFVKTGFNILSIHPLGLGHPEPTVKTRERKGYGTTDQWPRRKVDPSSSRVFSLYGRGSVRH